MKSPVVSRTSVETSTASTANVRLTELSVPGMTCGNCARRVTEAAQRVAGIHSVTVEVEARLATVRWAADSQPDVSAVIHALAAAGYQAKPVGALAGDQNHRQRAGWQLNLWIGVFGTVPILLGEWVFSGGVTGWFPWLSFGLAGVVQFVAGAQFYRGAWSQLKVGSSNMDTLVALGSTTAFAYSTWALLSGRGEHLYFLEAASIITLISVGHWLESRVSARASGALRQLLNLAPATARKLVSPSNSNPSALLKGKTPNARAASGFDPLHLRSFKPVVSELTSEREVAVAELQIGDQVVLRPGDRVPTDGEVVAGDSAVDEAMLTGESTPVDKSARSRLYTGTVNLNGRLVMRVTATGEATALAHIIAAVQRAQTSRANIQRLGDRVSSVFVPVVVAVALAAGLGWGFAPESARHIHAALAPYLWVAHPPADAAAAFIIAAAVLIIACPCAMGLATPAAIMASANAAARRGILIRDGAALEKAGVVNAVVFDKTGTLTLGKPVVVKIWENSANAMPGTDVKAYLSNLNFTAMAAALARNSTHPISQAITLMDAHQAEFTDWREVPGAGVQATLQPPRQTARLGALRWLRDSGVDFSAGEAFIAEWAAQGATLVGLAVEKSLLGILAVQDTLKPGAAKVVEQLHRQGLSVYLVTGDQGVTAMSLAKQAGIPLENVFAEVRPEQKAQFVEQRQRQGQRVAFVGDGINDAPALEQADLGIAVSRASDLAREAADIILLNSEIEAVPESLGLARATLRTIKQNLFWAFFYNAIGVPLAALGFMSPILCAAAMGFSDLIVIGNALRLRNWKLRG